MSDHLKIQTRSRFPLRYRTAGKPGLLRSQIILLSRRWLRRRATAELERLDDRLLADIGISRGQIPQVVDGLCRPQPRRPERDIRSAKEKS
jgi:uncharacterized protein YjiS (DUF1127 family)